MNIFDSTLDAGRENNRASDGTGSGARSAVFPLNRCTFTTYIAARHSSVSTGTNATCRPAATGRRARSTRN